MEQATKDVLLSIQPNYVTKILNGKKTIELRKKPFPAKDRIRVWIYTTSPTSAVEASVYVSNVEKGTPEEIWKKYQKKCCISKSEFDKYYDGADTAYAIHIENPQRLSKKITLPELKTLLEGFTPPQYYRYVAHDSDLFNALITK
jgi:predicted transcriptional regulator